MVHSSSSSSKIEVSKVSGVSKVSLVDCAQNDWYCENVDKELKGYHKLLLWEKLKNLVLITYELVAELPLMEDFGLKSQMRRAVVSVISNFVEGYLKKSSKEKLHFMEIAETSLLELEAQAEICLLLNYWDESEYEKFENKRKESAYFLFRYKSKLS